MRSFYLSSRHLLLIFAAWSLLFVFSASGQTPEKPSKLALGQPVERSIKGGETHVFEFDVKAGFYARAEVEQKNIDVIVSLFAPDGKLVVEMDGKDGRLWRQVVSCIAETGGLYRVGVKAYGEAGASGNYILRLAEMRSSVRNDRRQIDAQQLFSKKEYEKALRVWQELNDKQWEAITLNRLGWELLYQEDTESAVKAFNSALRIFTNISDKKGKTDCFIGLGRSFLKIGETKKSSEFFETALNLSESTSDKRNEFISLIYLAEFYNHSKQYHLAIDYWNRAISLSKEKNDKRSQAELLFRVANTHLKQRQYESAARCFEELLIDSMPKKLEIEIVSLINLGLSNYFLDRPEQAAPLFEKAALSALGRETAYAIIAFNNLGEAYRSMGKFADAQLPYDFAIWLFPQKGKFKASEFLGETEMLVGAGFDSIKRYERVDKDSSQNLINSSIVLLNKAIVWNNQGLNYYSTGKYGDSLYSYQKAREGQADYALEKSMSEKILDRIFYKIGVEKIIENNLALLYKTLGKYDEALFIYKGNLLFMQESKNPAGIVLSLINIGSLYELMQKHDESLSHFQQALLIVRDEKDKKGEGIILNNIGSVYISQKRSNEAIQVLNQSLQIRREIRDKSGEADTLNNIGSAYFTVGDYQQAVKSYLQSLQIEREIQNKPGETVTLNNLMLAWDALKNPRLAIIYGKESINGFQNLRSKITSLDEETQKKYLKTIEPTYRKVADLLISEERLFEAQAVLDLLKNAEYKDLARTSEGVNTIPYSKSEADVVSKIDKLISLEQEQADLQKLKRQLGDAFPKEKQQRLDQLTADIKTANAEFENALTALSKADTSVEARTLEIKSEKNLQSALQILGKELNTGAVALYTVIGTDEEKDASGKSVQDKTRSKFGWVILVTSKDRKAYPIDVTNLEQLVFQFREALSSDKYDPQPLAGKLYTAIFRQTSEKQKVTLEQDLREILDKYTDKTIMWSLDGVLRYIPMAALHDGDSYLVEKYRNVVFTKESLLWLMNQPKSKVQTLGLGISAGNKDLNMTALPGVEKELTEVVRQRDEKTGILDGRRRLNDQFKRDEILNLKDEENPFQVVHIASHYSFNLTDQNSSYLLIGDGNGKLTFGDMKAENNLFGTVDLLTLSACDTGVSGNGKEAEGFAYLAQSLGAKSVIASLWKVSDAGTPELMIRFYKLRAANPNMPKGEAFRRAQLSLFAGDKPVETKSLVKVTTPGNRAEVINSGTKKIELPLYDKTGKPPFAHPYYWASFVLIGNWR